MQVHDAIKNRISTRAYLDRPVASETIKEILEFARWAPSGVNTQPWQVAVATGETKRKIGDEIVAARLDEVKPNPDYQYYAGKLEGPYRERQKACGLALYGALNIQREDTTRRLDQWLKNYHGFGAPVELFIFIDACLAQGSWLDTGMFIQNVMLAARGFGLETCPQAAMAEYPSIVRKHLNLPQSLHLVCGIALGYANPDDPVNNYRTDREEVETFTTWHD